MEYVLDSNLLVLLVVGRCDRRMVERHRRLKKYSVTDYDRLEEMIRGGDRIIVTPNTLTETSNLLRAERGKVALALSQTLRAVIEGEVEVVIPSAEVANRTEFVHLGLTDAVLIAIASPARTLLTADMQLYGAAVALDANAAMYFRVEDRS